jgi:hypothetical protein
VKAKYTRRDKGRKRTARCTDLCPTGATRRHLPGNHPTRTACGGSIAWCNVTTNPALATCPVCVGRSV